MLLSRLGEEGFAFALTPQEADTVRGVLGEMHPVTPDSLHFVKAAPSNSWVLKKTKEKRWALSVWGRHPKIRNTGAPAISGLVTNGPITSCSQTDVSLDSTQRRAASGDGLDQ